MESRPWPTYWARTSRPRLGHRRTREANGDGSRLTERHLDGQRQTRLDNTFVRREDAERFIGDVRGDDPELTGYLRIEERELEAGERNWAPALLSQAFLAHEASGDQGTNA